MHERYLCTPNLIYYIYEMQNNITMRHLIVSVAIIASWMLSGCSESAKTESRQPIRVSVDEVKPCIKNSDNIYVGVVEEIQSTMLSFPISGTITRMYVNEGQTVAFGQTIAVVDNTTAESTLAAAKASMEQTIDAKNRMDQLYANSSLPEIKLIEINTQVQQSESAYQMALKNYNDCVLKAPFRGVIGKKHLSTGENAMPGQPVYSLLDISTVRVKIAVPEKEIAGISKTSKPLITVPALQDCRFNGISIEKGVVGNSFSHTYDLFITVANESGQLLPGMVCSVHIPNMDENPVITVPLRALQKDNHGKTFVWKVSDDTAQRSYVRTGRLVGNEMEITDGLQSGERIITEGYQKVSEGTTIRF